MHFVIFLCKNLQNYNAYAIIESSKNRRSLENALQKGRCCICVMEIIK